jgi:GntR family transcriptional regulator / MocR family aminotransferase
VILMGTFEGVMYPSLRIGYVVVPERLVDVFVAARGLLGDHTSVAPQLALARFIDEGHLSAHLRRLRQVCATRRDALLRAVHALLPAEVTPGPMESGLHACLHLGTRWRDHDIVARLRLLHVGAEALSTRCWQARDRNGLIVSFAAATPDEIAAAVARIAEVLAATRAG